MAGWKDCRGPKTPSNMHVPLWSEVAKTPQARTLQTLLRRAVWPVIVLNPKYLWHYFTQPVMGSPPLLKFCTQLVHDGVEGQKILSLLLGHLL